jgi:chromosome partitioning protein
MTSPTVIPVISASGGVGKTTLSLLLAYHLIECRLAKPGELLIIDLDPNAGLSQRVLGDGYEVAYQKRKSLLHMYLDKKQGLNIRLRDYTVTPLHLKDMGLKIEIINELNSVDILLPGQAEIGLLSSVIDEWFRNRGPQYLKELLEEAGISSFKYVIVDSAPFIDERYVRQAIELGRPLILLRPTITDIRRTMYMIKILRMSDKDLRPLFLFNFDKDKLGIEAATLAQKNSRAQT